MSPFDLELQQRLDAIRAKGLMRELRRVDSPQGTRLNIGGRTLINFSSNDYLGLAAHPALRSAAAEAAQQFGAGSGASRLICGSLAPFHELEDELAAFKGTEAALTFATGYSAVVGTISALLGRDDILIVDKLVHACVVDAARLCGATLRVFDHNDLDDLESILKWADNARSTNSKQQKDSPQILIVTESVFSMDGDAAPLREIVALKERYGAWLMVDEAHATGLLGANRCGLAEKLGVADRIEIQMGTLGKAVGAAGGYICGSRSLVDYLVNRARSFIFSTAPVPAAAAAARAGLKIIRSDEGAALCGRLHKHVAALNSRLNMPTSVAAIIPVIIGDETAAMDLAARLNYAGIFVPAIRYPTVARSAARLRITLSATHRDDDIVTLNESLTKLNPA